MSACVYSTVYIQKGISALYGACRNGHTRVVERLLEASANINIPDYVSDLCTYIVCYHHSTCQQLLDNVVTDCISVATFVRASRVKYMVTF